MRDVNDETTYRHNKHIIYEEQPCPCEESGRENCCVCQDLPIGYFEKSTSTAHLVYDGQGR